MLGCAVAATLAADDDVVFKSDVSLVRVDAQVVDSSNRVVSSSFHFGSQATGSR